MYNVKTSENDALGTTINVLRKAKTSKKKVPKAARRGIISSPPRDAPRKRGPLPQKFLEENFFELASHTQPCPRFGGDVIRSNFIVKKGPNVARVLWKFWG